MTLLSEIRDTKKLTQEDVARDLAIHVRTVIRHETGETKLRPIHRQMYGHYYGVVAESIEQPELVKT